MEQPIEQAREPPPPPRLTRRSHTKSKKGCITCRRRHIRCDEGEPICRNCLRYGSSTCYAVGDAAAATSTEGEQSEGSGTSEGSAPRQRHLWPANVVNELDTWVNDQTWRTPVLEMPGMGALLATMIEANDDTRTLYHIGRMVASLVHERNSQTLCHGLVVLPEFLDQAKAHRFVRDAMVALSAYQLSWLTKSTGLDVQMAKYRAQASKGLAKALNDFSKGNSDALLTASVVLAWTSPDDHAFAQFLSGIITLVQQVSTWKDESRLTTLMGIDQPLPTNDRRLMVAYLSLSEDDLVQMKPLIANLTTMTRRFEQGSESLSTAQSILTFVHNVRLLSSKHLSFLQQASVLRSIKTWVPFCPRMADGLEARDLHIMTVTAYFHAASIASETYLPDVSPAIFLSKRCEAIGNIWTELLRLEAESGDNSGNDDHFNIGEAIRMVVVPLVYAVRYRLRHTASVEMVH